MRVNSSKWIFNEIGLSWNQGELLFYFIEEDGAEFIDVHLVCQLYYGFVIRPFDALSEEYWTQSYLLWMLKLHK